MSPSRPSNIIVIGAGVVGCGRRLRARAPRRSGADARRSAARHGRHAGVGGHARAVHRIQGSQRRLSRSRRPQPRLVRRVRQERRVERPARRSATSVRARWRWPRAATHMAELEDLADRLKGRGVALRLLDAHAARAEEPHLSADVAGGLLIDPHGFVNAVELTRALAVAARRHGAAAIEGSRATRISRSSAGVVVETSAGTLSADAVVLAAGSWSAQVEIDGVARPPVRPVRGQLLHLAWRGTAVRRVTLGRTLLHRAVGGRHAARRRDDGGGGVR